METEGAAVAQVWASMRACLSRCCASSPSAPTTKAHMDFNAFIRQAASRYSEAIIERYLPRLHE